MIYVNGTGSKVVRGGHTYTQQGGVISLFSSLLKQWK
jgi:hypothetical protein